MRLISLGIFILTKLCLASEDSCQKALSKDQVLLNMEIEQTKDLISFYEKSKLEIENRIKTNQLLQGDKRARGSKSSGNAIIKDHEFKHVMNMYEDEVLNSPQNRYLSKYPNTMTNSQHGLKPTVADDHDTVL